MMNRAILVIALFGLAYAAQTEIKFQSGSPNKQCAEDNTLNTKNCYYFGSCFTECVQQPSGSCRWEFAYPESGKALSFKCDGDRLINGVIFHSNRWDFSCCEFSGSTITNCGTDRVNAPWDLTLQSVDVNSAWNHFVFRGCRVQ